MGRGGLCHPGGKRSSVRAFQSLLVKVSGTRGRRDLQGALGQEASGIV